MTRELKKLSAQRLRFVEEYLVDLNATQAAIRAGYSASAAKVTASRLLTDANVASAISDLRSKLSRKLELTAENVLSELAKIGFANMADFYQRDERGNLVVDVDTLTDPVKAAAVVQMDVQTSADGTQMIKLKLGDKKGALIELGKHLGLFNDKFPVVELQQTVLAPDPRHLAMALLATLRAAREAERNSGALIEAQ
jgi:phage terminase small subunit